MGAGAGTARLVHTRIEQTWSVNSPRQSFGDIFIGSESSISLLYCTVMSIQSSSHTFFVTNCR